MKMTYKTSGTCSSAIEIEMDENRVVQNVRFIGGCHGNTQGISALVKGMPAEAVIERLSGIRCGMKRTSCPDQLSRALREMLGE